MQNIMYCLTHETPFPLFSNFAIPYDLEGGKSSTWLNLRILTGSSDSTLFENLIPTMDYLHCMEHLSQDRLQSKSHDQF